MRPILFLGPTLAVEEALRILPEADVRPPVRAGDVLEVTATVTRVGRRSREVGFTAHVVCRGRPDLGESSAEALAEPVLAVSATGTIVVPPQ